MASLRALLGCDRAPRGARFYTAMLALYIDCARWEGASLATSQALHINTRLRFKYRADMALQGPGGGRAEVRVADGPVQWPVSLLLFLGPF